MSGKKAVSFGLIHVREYDRVVGDNPSVKFGPPISIGWDFVQKQALPVDVYESTKLPREEDLHMSSIDRRLILRGFDVSWAEIRAAEEEVQKIRKERLQTRYQGKAGRAIEKVTQPAKRILKRTTAWFLPIRRRV
jgi:hypothetical protein